MKSRSAAALRLELREISANGMGGAIHLEHDMNIASSRPARLRLVDHFAQGGGALHSGQGDPRPAPCFRSIFGRIQ